ncbi:MgtC/SapB family protein [Paracidobacterium acidisoli]|uniref:MgtC/SapB family protein n=1 Tax=Paracidobacterium acidisoli TaxID=2303751 RepID=A0A372IJK1_9BACT|nr:MgtC/SapB family protein [Paracidobacterium acidisoli]MBT9333056.1 MgtC/SapB family protein [Paracidobacterium acidisoli]
MILVFDQGAHMTSFNQLQQMILTSDVAGRLLLAALLGGAIGIDREYHHKPSGVRTNLLICFGAALFTFLSTVVAGDTSPNKAQIASNIVQGIGFLGAGLILHNRDRVSGLTSAATVWAVASIGMACGAGLYVPAIFSTVLVLVVLEVVGVLETKSNLKFYSVVYETRGRDAEKMTLAILRAMDRENRQLSSVDHDSIGELERVSFTVATTHRGHRRMLESLKASPIIDEVHIFRDPEDE